MPKRISLIAAVAKNLVIGDATGIPWRLPADLKRFRKLTLDKPIVMGRTTFEHIGKPLDRRLNVVLSRNSDYHPAGVEVAANIEEAIDKAVGATEVMVIGGEQAYRAAFPRATRIYMSWVMGEFPGTARFPAIADWPCPPDETWEVTHRESVPGDVNNEYDHHFVIYERTPKEMTAGRRTAR
ncbi:dihydrofolate reductase [Zavarzinella formosa]|uniref:dihydrofolate reductase n=1 Tax=Zavarzinella formosa TaxID=360055 RepID=UPI000315C687|nr:dihydrofolate reductase [Zavarzinella formosa]